MEWQYSLLDIDKAASALWDFLVSGDTPDVLAFTGEMGAGKTTLIQALGRRVGVTDIMSSPTFSIINEYPVPGGTIFHIDLYRCEDEGEARRAGVEDCLLSGNMCFVEWPSVAPGLFPPSTRYIELKTVDHHTRLIVVD